MTECIRGCTSRNHKPDCTCTPECGAHPDHCEGCTPALAVIGELCGRCAGRILEALNALPELAIQAASRIDGRLSTPRENTDTTRRATNPNPPSPSPAWDSAEEVFQWALNTALNCADANGHRGPFRYRADGVPARNLTQLITYIKNNIGWYAQEFPREFYDEVTGMKRNLARATGLDRLVHRLKARCPSCDQLTLVRDNGADNVECRNRDCARIWREDEYARLAHVATA